MSTGPHDSFAREILQQINKLRRFPNSFIPILEDHLQYFEGNALFLPNSPNGGLLMEEGPVAWNEFLEKAAKDHLKDIGVKGILSHIGSDKSNYKQRIEKYCQWGGSIFEAIDYGPRDQAKEVVIAWLVDDGVPKRIHRNNLFYKDHQYCAISSGNHKTAQFCSVAVFAAQVVSKEYKQLEVIGIDKKRQEIMQNKDWIKFAQEVFDFQNKVRTNPQCLIPQLEKSLARFNNHVLMSADGTSGMETQEGPVAYIEAIEFLRGLKGLTPLKQSPQLGKAALDHINDIGPKGITSSLGSGMLNIFQFRLDGSLPTDRLARYCQIDESWAESLCFQSVSAQEVIERLIVDDGQPARGHRKNIFNKDLQYCGTATGPHSQLDNVVLLDYASNILKEGELPSINITVQEEVPEELIQKMKAMGIDIEKIKVKKDTKDAQIKAQALFKKATTAITFANRLGKKVNEKIMGEDQNILFQTQDNINKKDAQINSQTKGRQPMIQKQQISARPASNIGMRQQKTPLGSQKQPATVREQHQDQSKTQTNLGIRKSVSPFQRALEEKKQFQQSQLTTKQISPKTGSPTHISSTAINTNSKTYLDKLKKQNTMTFSSKAKMEAQYQSSPVKQKSQAVTKSKTTINRKEETKKKSMIDPNQEFNIENDPDMPEDAVNSNVIIEEIEMNGKKQKVYRKTYQLIDGRTVAITRMEQM